MFVLNLPGLSFETKGNSEWQNAVRIYIYRIYTYSLYIYNIYIYMCTQYIHIYVY